MPNPPIPPQTFTGESSTWQENGILGFVHHDDVHRASKHLPTPSADLVSDPVRHVTITDVPKYGTVRITFKLWSYKHYRQRHWKWGAVHAEAVPPGESG